MEDGHRWLTLSGDHRNLGKSITGAASAGFFFLCLSGLYLWWPQSLTGRRFRAILTFNGKLSGKARDWNRHNVIGFWCLPMLIVSSSTGMIMSYRWANDALFRVTGTPAPAAEDGEARLAQSTFEIKRPSEGARPLGYDALVANAQKDFPFWDLITIRLGNPRQRGAGGAPGQMRPAENVSDRAERPAPREGRGTGGSESRRGGPQAVTLMIHETGQWPRTAATTLTLNPFTGEILKQETFADQSAGRQARTWARYLHTGEALGFGGQIIAFVAALGACLLIYTGFALAWRRFFGRKESAVS